ncbi:haloalkane dehalogenase [Pseudoduganella sp. DS3]|uniref:Haloalkane dehalogenase n=1 Tax=Pseudoduganella guangdongensis TaxID=2692179 RepID=A0A6N9HBJ4_9BURK|nr:haloalkane dehalogenase [Pseudoduganella guangdongensis]MYN00522.1 haloalkane dehalogenase [Pseudoduganella guangdongensis]
MMQSVSVLTSSIAYRELGQRSARAVIFLHGNPTHSYIWRHIMPHVAQKAYCLAPDLIGFGASGKPDIAYSFLEHAAYLEAFLQQMAVEELILVGQDWGGALAIHLAARYPSKVRGVALMEFVRPSPTWEDFHPLEQARERFKLMRAAGTGEEYVLQQNFFIEQMLPKGSLRTLTAEEMDAYRAPFPTPESRKPMLAFPRMMPIAGEPADVYELIERNESIMATAQYPKLILFSPNGVLTPRAVAERYAARFANSKLVELGEGTHNIQEDHPEAIGRAIADWLP